ncbi:terpenoid synthase [Suillus fuscotomentosus]|uniref:Terpenoid synthase n=1 Tax=Suillus fuscotomentosus TaxID=1912939 RepID=A0AAD4HQG8_9AGAM|nr:terpenoid synthase [Suillus fuscotomentosus]KAG1905248.1 terpenoid synthase [Suillus fuscotomentosus]
MIYLPDTMTNWPWPRTINSHFEDMKAEVNALIHGFKAVSPESRAAFSKCFCDLINAFLFLDEYTDTENGVVTKEIVDIILGSTIQSTSLSSRHHFLETFTASLHGFVAKALDHEQGHRRSINDYMKLWQYTVCLKPCLFIYEMEMDLPDEVFHHHVIMDLAECITDLVLIDNDMISYTKEQAAGNKDHNMISIIMLEVGLDISVPSWGPSVDILVKEYLYGIAMWPQANHSWSYKIHRYFATSGPKIQQTRIVPLLPRPDCVNLSSRSIQIRSSFYRIWRQLFLYLTYFIVYINLLPRFSVCPS